MIAEICYGGGCFARALKKSDDIPTRAAIARELRAQRARALTAVIGQPRLRPVTLPSLRNSRRTAALYRDLERLTCRDLDRLLRAQSIPGRSKARRKAQKIELLLTSGRLTS